MNSAINRIKHLMQLNVFDIDVNCVQEYDYGFLRLLRHQKKVAIKSVQEVEGIKVNVIYKKCIFLDMVLETVLKIPSVYSPCCFRRIARRLKGYDLVIGHSTIGGVVAKMIKDRYDTPYCVVWHGSDIHTNPVNNKRTKSVTQQILKNSSGNFFVSLSLLNSAKELFKEVPSPHITYNAPGEKFVRFSQEKRNAIRLEKGASGKKVVAFVGNLVQVKNVFVLPGLFKRVQERCEDVVFWVIGDGMHRQALINKMKEAGVECKFWGNQQPESMPDYMNCIDVLVLPSINESFGMVLAEAISCGANAVGSNRGGIPEVIGRENCFDLDDSFEEKTADRIVYMLNNTVYQHVDSVYNWDATAKIESEIFLSILSHKKQV